MKLLRKQNHSLHSKRFHGAKSKECGFQRPREKWGKSKIRRRGWGKGKKETLADKPFDLCALRHERPSGRFSKSRGLSASVSF